MPSTDLAKAGSGPILKVNKAPEALGAIINLEAWASSVIRGTPYPEPDPEFISRMLALKAITAESVEEVFQQANIRQLQKMLPENPGATTGPLEIIDLYVASSDFETGNPSYCIITAMDLELGEEFKFTTGATNIQATLIGLLANGAWPVRCQFKRGDSKDKGGRYLMHCLPPD